MPRRQNPAVEGRGVHYCLNVGGIQIDEAVAQAFIAALEPAKLAATDRRRGGARGRTREDLARGNGSLGVEQGKLRSQPRRARAIAPSIPDNRLVARGLERECGRKRLSALEAAEAELLRREEARPRALCRDGDQYLARARS